jgi:PPK2 family polyphosphate:nucleotide phosphotransferase
MSDAAEAVGFQTSPTESLKAGLNFRLDDVDPTSKPGYPGGKREGQALLLAQDGQLASLQMKLFAASRGGGKGALLLVLQGMDTSGKGGIVSHVVGAVDPQGVRYHAFKAPTEEEQRHDFLWRIHKELPAAGMIGAFDRSHYEEVLIHRVRELSSSADIETRYGVINDFEAALTSNGVTVIKVMLHISPQEQKRRLTSRLERGDKQWKYSPTDVDERALWAKYMEAYQIAIERTTSGYAPWYVVPADKKWYARIAVQHLLISALRKKNLKWPKPSYDVEAEKARLSTS